MATKKTPISRGKQMVKIALRNKSQKERQDKRKAALPSDAVTSNSKVSAWLENQTIVNNETETDFLDNDDDMDLDYIPESNDSSSVYNDASGSKIIEIQDQCCFQGTGGHGEVNATTASTSQANKSTNKEVNATTASTSQANKSTKSKKKKPKRLCKFCNTWNVHLTRHLKRKHKMEEEVALALKLPRKDQERAFQALKKEGIFKANMEKRKTTKDALLIRERCQGSAETVMCTGCMGFYDAKSIFKHKRMCERNVSALSTTAKLYELSDSAEAAGVDQDFKENVLDRFRKDDIGQICRTDLVTIIFGKKQWAKSIKKERNITMSEMRIFANLILAFRLETGEEGASGQEILNYRRFEALEKAIKNVATKETGDDKAGLKVRIGFVLKKAAKIMRGYFVMKADAQKEADMTRFLDVIDLQWHYIFLPAQVECEQKRTSLRKPSAMPDEDDVSHFRDFIKQEMVKLADKYEMWDKHTFVRARNLVVARLTMFNAPRGGEPARLTLKEWEEAITDAWIDPNLVEKIDDPMEKHLVENLKLAYQSGKGSRKMVPVLITEDTVELITKLVCERSNCQISEHNVYLFPNTGASLDHASGYHCLKSIVDTCPSLKKPKLLIADKFRHRVSTMFAQLDIPDEQRHIFYSHMGHSETINKNVYQCPLAVREVTQVGKFLLNDDNRYVTNTKTGPQQGLDQLNSSENGEQITVDETNIPLNEHEGEIVVQTQAECILEVSESSGQTRHIEKKSGRNYTKWSEAESNLVKEYFKDYISDTTNNGRLPGKHEVLKFLEEVSILEGYENKIHLVKTKVFNEKKKYRGGKFKRV